jgi:hypothetical protein
VNSLALNCPSALNFFLSLLALSTHLTTIFVLTFN